MKKCPFCAEDIQDDAVKCKHCGSMLSDQQASANPKVEGNGPRDHRRLGGFIGFFLYILLLLPLILEGKWAEFGSGVVSGSLWIPLLSYVGYAVGRRFPRRVDSAETGSQGRPTSALVASDKIAAVSLGSTGITKAPVQAAKFNRLVVWSGVIVLVCIIGVSVIRMFRSTGESVITSELHRSMTGHWIEYTSHMHAYITHSSIVLKEEGNPRLETYSYRVYSEDGLRKTLLLKVMGPGDVAEQTWEAQALDFGQGMTLNLGRARFSYVDSQTKP